MKDLSGVVEELGDDIDTMYGRQVGQQLEIQELRTALLRLACRVKVLEHELGFDR